MNRIALFMAVALLETRGQTGRTPFSNLITFGETLPHSSRN
jgi:hypothetical protein